MNRRKWAVWVGLACSVGLLYLALRSVRFHEFGLALRRAGYGWLAAALATLVFSYYLRALRWSRILAAVHPVSGHGLFPYILIGFFGNIVLPARLGEVARAHFAGVRLGFSRSSVFGSIVVDRTLEFVAILLWAFAAAAWVPDLPPLVRRACWTSLLVLLAVLAVLYLLIWKPEAAPALLERWTASGDPGRLSGRLLSRLPELWRKFGRGLEALRRPGLLLQAAPLAVLVWAADAVGLVLAGRAFGLEMDLGQAGLVLVMIVLGVSLPAAPGFFGNFEFFGRTAMTWMGFPGDISVMTLLTYHILMILLQAALGLFFLARFGLRLSDVDRSP